MAFGTDVLSKERLKTTCGEVLIAFGQIDTVLNIAGGNLPRAAIGEDQTIFHLGTDDFKKVTDLNSNGTVLTSDIFGLAMANQESRVIIN